jgi:hypothetical protein
VRDHLPAVLRWSRQGTFMMVALRGTSEQNQRLLLALADHLRPVRP